MKSSYEARNGHRRLKVANIARVLKAQRRAEAEERNAAYQALSLEEKLKRIASAPGKSQRQLAKLGIESREE